MKLLQNWHKYQCKYHLPPWTQANNRQIQCKSWNKKNLWKMCLKETFLYFWIILEWNWCYFTSCIYLFYLLLHRFLTQLKMIEGIKTYARQINWLIASFNFSFDISLECHACKTFHSACIVGGGGNSLLHISWVEIQLDNNNKLSILLEERFNEIDFFDLPIKQHRLLQNIPWFQAHLAK